MLGYYRFVLAAAVALSHWLPNFGLPLPRINFGASAVVTFYFISGYLMCLSFGRFRKQVPNPARAFYADRIIRLYPSFLLVYAAASLFLFFGLGHSIFDSLEWVAEVLVIPSNYTLMALPLPPAVAVNPPTWSLGAEFQFYLLLPLVFLTGRVARVGLLVIVLAGQIAAMAVSGVVSTYAPIWCHSISAEFCSFPVSDLLAYRWLPFAIAPFLLGVVIAEQPGNRWFPSSLVAITAVYGSIFIMVETGVGFQNALVGEIAIAMAVLVPIAFVMLTQFSSQGKIMHRLRGDRIAGNLAYPLFLCHALGIAITKKTLVTGWSAAMVSIILMLAMSALIAAFQTRIDRLRYRYRGFGALRAPDNSSGMSVAAIPSASKT